LLLVFFVFFFSSRRRHTRLQGDWSSDVCSSDLKLSELGLPPISFIGHGIGLHLHEDPYLGPTDGQPLEAGMVLGIEPLVYQTGRSEERRVGKECRSRWSPYH